MTDDPILSFKLRKQQLIELIRDNAVDKALALAARELAPTSTTDVRKLVCVWPCAVVLRCLSHIQHTHLPPAPRSQPSLLEELEEVMALLAFPDAAAAPVGGLLSDAQREATAGLVNTAILTHQGQPTGTTVHTSYSLYLLTYTHTHTRTHRAFRVSPADSVEAVGEQSNATARRMCVPSHH